MAPPAAGRRPALSAAATGGSSRPPAVAPRACSLAAAAAASALPRSVPRAGRRGSHGPRTGRRLAPPATAPMRHAQGRPCELCGCAAAAPPRLPDRGARVASVPLLPSPPRPIVMCVGHLPGAAGSERRGGQQGARGVGMAVRQRGLWPCEGVGIVRSLRRQ